MRTDQEMNTEWTVQHDMRNFASFTSILDALQPHMSLGYGAYPVGGVQGGKGTSSLEVLRDRFHRKQQDDT